jgi:hypothetical protein
MAGKRMSMTVHDVTPMSLPCVMRINSAYLPVVILGNVYAVRLKGAQKFYCVMNEVVKNHVYNMLTQLRLTTVLQALSEWTK